MLNASLGDWLATTSLVAVLALMVAGCSPPADKVNTGVLETREWINPGAPAAPRVLEGDWFKRGWDDAAEGLSVGQIGDAAGYGMIVRWREGTPRLPVKVVIQPASCLIGSKSFDGYTLFYDDRIELVVTPTDSPMDVAAELESEDMTTTSGQTRLWRRTSVRGFDAVQRPLAVQKWESGTVNEMPAVLEWVEPSDTPGGPPYIRYALLGDVELGRLHALAAELAGLK